MENNELQKLVVEEAEQFNEMKELIEAGLDDWDKDSIKSFSDKVGKTPDDKGFHKACSLRMGKHMSEKQAAGFCAKLMDKWKGNTTWRGKHED